MRRRQTVEHRSQSEAERVAGLRRLLPLWPHEIADRSLAGQERICRLLRQALRQQRQRGVAGHWTYDVTRHAALVRTLAPELRRLATMRARTRMPTPTAAMAARSDASPPL